MGNIGSLGGGRTSGRLYGIGGVVSNHRRTPSNLSNASASGQQLAGLASSSNVNPSFRLEDELDALQAQAASALQPGRVAFDLDPMRGAAPTTFSSNMYRRQNSLEMERPSTLVRHNHLKRKY